LGLCNRTKEGPYVASCRRGSRALAVASADPAAAQRVRAGVLTCDISGGISFIIGSQKSIACTFAPEPPGPAQVYSGSTSKVGLDVGATGEEGWYGRCSRTASLPPAPPFSPAIISARAAR